MSDPIAAIDPGHKTGACRPGVRRSVRARIFRPAGARHRARHRKGDGGARAFHAVARQPAAMQLDQRLAEREAETGSLDLLRPPVLPLLEGLPLAGPAAPRYATPVVPPPT